jgi:hypothetical protein
MSNTASPMRSPCWYDRADVNAVLGDHDQPSGFIALVRVDDPQAFSRPFGAVRLHQRRPAAPAERRALAFVGAVPAGGALGACAILADRPIGETLASGKILHRQFSAALAARAAGHEVREGARGGQPSARCAAASSSPSTARRTCCWCSLSELAEFLERAAVEVIVVLNDVANAAALAEEVMAFCQIHPISDLDL